MGRPRQTKLDAIKFLATRDGESKQFGSRRDANLFVASARRTSKVEPIYWKCRYWVLEVERVPGPGEEHLEYQDFSNKRLSEREAVLKGSDPDELLARAEGLRRASYAREWLTFTSERNLRQLSPKSRQLAIESIEQYYERDDERSERQEAERERKRTVQAEQNRIRSIPTVKAVFESEVQRKVVGGSIERNTADIYLYESSAFGIETSIGPVRKPLADVQVHELTRASIKEWFGTYAARTTRLGKLPTAKTCVSALTHLRTVGKALRKDDELSAYAAPFEILDGMIEEVRNAKGKGDGWRNRHRLTNAAVGKLIGVCHTDLERAALALALAGPRPPSEPVAVEWSHLESDSAGNLWWHVEASAIEQVGGELELRSHTKTKDVDYRQLSIAKRFVPWITALKNNSSKYVLGSKDGPMRPSDYTAMVEELIRRAEIDGPGISTYSLRHTVADEVERLLGRTARDLILHGRRDRSTGSAHYSHAQRDRRRSELTFEGQPYGEHMVWARTPG